MPKFSSNSQSYLGQAMFQIIDRARELEQRGKDVIHLELGDPDFNTPSNIRSAAIRSLEANETHYVSSWGLHDFRLSIARATMKSRGFHPDLTQVLVTPGANVAIYYSMATTLDLGDEVLVPDPGFPSYLACAAALGVRAVPYSVLGPEGSEIDLGELESKITVRTKMIVVNTPSNPTGEVLGEKLLKKIYQLAKRKDLWVYSDEIYARLVFDQEHFSMASLDEAKERVILANGFSKAFSMTGWRLGTMIGPPRLIEKAMLLLQTTASCVSPFVQRAGIEALEGDQYPVNAMAVSYAERRNKLVKSLENISGLTLRKPSGAFYAFPDISSFGLSSIEFAQGLLESEYVAVVPGIFFGANGEGKVRLSFAASESRLSESVHRLDRYCKGLL